jgi:hypothetical protein
MFVRFREVKAERYDRNGYGGERICAGKCKDRPRSYPRYGIGMIVPSRRKFLEGCPMKPICPLAHPSVRLEVSLVETHRIDGRVRQQHIASLGSINGDDRMARLTFWEECEARLARLSNRIGSDLDRIRQAIAARIPPFTDADWQVLEAAAWDSLEDGWDNHGKEKARDSSYWNELAKRLRREATEAEATTLQVKRLRGNPGAFDALRMLLGHKLCADAMGRRVDHDKIEQQLKQEIDASARDVEEVRR